jgi:sulfite exporter TauE/SafE/copper chaperone CopZ
MHCRSCELLLEDKIGQVQGVTKVKVNYKKHEAEITHGADLPSRDEITRAVRDGGYDIGANEAAPWLSEDSGDYRNLFKALFIVGVLYLAYRSLGGLGLNLDTKNVSLGMAVAVGLVAGLSTCMAMVGGLIMGLAASHAEIHPEATAWEKFRPHLYFNAGRVGGYAFFGGLLGLVGGVIQLSNGALSLLTLAVGAVMVYMGLKLSGLSPWLKEGGLTLPAGLARVLGLGRHQKEYNHFSAALTGALTFFLPCGFTQAMQLYAVSTGSYTRGALVMGLFALGTAPVLLGIGGLTSVIKGATAKLFYAVVGIAILIFGLFNVGNGLALAGFNTGAAKATKTAGVAAEEQDGVQVVRMTQKANGYSPNSFTVKKGVPVRWIITSETALSCAASISMPTYQIFQQLSEGENVIEFTPTETGTLPFSCSMGMYRGTFTVTDGETSALGVPTAQAVAPSASTGGSCGSGGGGCGCGGMKARVPVAGTTQAAPDIQKIVSHDDGGLSPNEFTVTSGTPVEWTVVADAPPVGCMVGFYNTDLGLAAQEVYPGSTVMKFTPTVAGDYDVTCPMGMGRAIIHVK